MKSSLQKYKIMELRAADGAGGGPEKTIIEGSAIAADRFKISIVYISSDLQVPSPIEIRAKAKGLDFEQLTHRRLLDWKLYRRLCEIVSQKSIDLVHAHDYKSNFFAYLLYRKFHLKTLSTAHGWTGNSWRERRLYYPSDLFLLKRFQHVIAVSSEIENTLIKRGIRRTNLTMLPNGVDGQMFFNDGKNRKMIRDAWGVQPTNFVIGSVGRLARQKRFDLLIRAFAKVFLEFPNAMLIFAGDGPDFNSLTSVMLDIRNEMPIDLRDRFIGSIKFLGNQSDIASVYKGFDCFVQSSEYEGTPNVVLEAMAMEIPIVATSAGGTEDVLRGDLDGLIVPVGSVSALREAIRLVINDPDSSQKRAKTAREQVETKLDFRLRNLSLEAIYDRMLSTETS